MSGVTELVVTGGVAAVGSGIGFLRHKPREPRFRIIKNGGGRKGHWAYVGDFKVQTRVLGLYWRTIHTRKFKHDYESYVGEAESAAIKWLKQYLDDGFDRANTVWDSKLDGYERITGK
jgi:hypothetical protein